MGEPSWLEVSLRVDGELAEAVAEVLARFALNGVVIESDSIRPDPEGEGTPVGPVRVYAYLPVDAALEDTRQRLEEALWHLGQIQTLPTPAYQTIENQDWMAAWKQHYNPIRVGQRLLILPPWLEPDAPQRQVVRIDPGMAFGTGTHPTTQLCLELMETYVRPGEMLIDVGGGSGILSIAGILLGADRALTVDVDPTACRIGQENAALNQVAGRIEIGLGSVAEIRQGQFSMRDAPLVIVNILAPIILRLFAGGLRDLVTPGGVLLLSGILLEQLPEILQAAGQQGLQALERRQMGDWVALAFRR
ncbi:MAG: 50S ribosomal protein L11 methyltransferase [Chloroflexi bacterium]|nr:50S ribosomal protein L11 methyltransferase [Chloroflexota bacterium]